jgi:hypothetical protein
MATRKSILQRIRDELTRLVGFGRQARPEPAEEEAVPPPPPPPTTRYDDWFPSPPTIATPERGGVVYVPSHTQTVSGRYNLYNQRVLGYWTVGDDMEPASMSDVRDILSSASRSFGDVNLVVGGKYFMPYPGQEGEDVTWLTYVYLIEELRNVADYLDAENATDFINEIIGGFGESWDEVYTIKIVDK